jgi:hypothetical protein
VDSLKIHLVGTEWVREWTLLRTTQLVEPPVKPQRVRCNLGKTIEHPCSDVLAHTPEVCKGTRLYNEYPTIKDDRDSWGMCTTSALCKTVITAMLTVMSGMDPHMISGTWVWLVKLGLVSIVG